MRDGAKRDRAASAEAHTRSSSLLQSRPRPQSYFFRAGRLADFFPADFFLVDRLADFLVVFFFAVFFLVDFLAVARFFVARFVTLFLGDRLAVFFLAAFFVAISVAPYWAFCSVCSLSGALLTRNNPPHRHADDETREPNDRFAVRPCDG